MDCEARSNGEGNDNAEEAGSGNSCNISHNRRSKSSGVTNHGNDFSIGIDMLHSTQCPPRDSVQAK